MKSSRLVLAVALASAGCAVLPEGEREERERALAAGHAFDERIDPLPLPEEPALEDYLRTAFHASAALQQRYWEWRAALERIPRAASPPDLALSFAHLFDSGNLKAWDRTTLTLQSDPSTMIPLPSKLAAAGRVALEEARAAAARFEAEKFRLQAEVASTYLDLALHGALLELQQRELRLLGLAAGATETRARTGTASQAELLQARTELDLAHNELANLHAQLPSLVARMNVLLGRHALHPAPLPPLPEPRALPATDGEILRLAAERSPELAALEHELAGRGEALELARLARLPDFAFLLSLTGSLSQSVGATFTLPLRLPAIRAGIEEARAKLRAAEAAREQYARELAASFVLDLYVLRNAERQRELFERTLVPRAAALAAAARVAFEAGSGGLDEFVEAARTQLEAERTLALLRIEREKALVALESWSALDVEALHPVRASAGM